MLPSLLSKSKMYSPSSPTFSSLDRSSAIAAASDAAAPTNAHAHASTNANATIHSSSSSTGSHNFPQFSSLNDAHYDANNSPCVRFKYFTTFIICTICLALLSASLATHKWIVARPIRILKLPNSAGQAANLTSLMLTAQQDPSDSSDRQDDDHRYRYPSALLLNLNSLAGGNGGELVYGGPLSQQQQQQRHRQLQAASSTKVDNKFQGEIYFGLFKGVKVLNYGFGDRYIPISVWQTLFSKHQQQQTAVDTTTQQHQELVSFKLWLLTLTSVAVAILFALIGSIFAIINFVIAPGGTLTGPVGLVIWNATACFACLLATISWLIEYFVRLQTNVLSLEELQSGWTSENRSQFGYSYYLVVAAFVLHLVNIFIVSIVQFETWNHNKAAKRQSRALCEGVIMLY